jgi:hypothetical protein
MTSAAVMDSRSATVIALIAVSGGWMEVEGDR